MWPAARCWNWQLTSVFNEERSLAKDLLHPRIASFTIFTDLITSKLSCRSILLTLGYRPA